MAKSGGKSTCKFLEHPLNPNKSGVKISCGQGAASLPKVDVVPFFVRHIAIAVRIQLKRLSPGLLHSTG